ncbi:hypothetical protein QQF64_014963 [Cirrhinus molitorella]|uniref:Uncharacterized protein n=1 Tax=Cirrhinus molitorella TaxID=172907 RepID=A0ABR3NTP4_9TELE
MNSLTWLHGGYMDGRLYLMLRMCRHSESTAPGCVLCPSEHRLPVSAGSPDKETSALFNQDEIHIETGLRLLNKYTCWQNTICLTCGA